MHNLTLAQMTNTEFGGIVKYTPVYHIKRKLLGYVVGHQTEVYHQKLMVVWINHSQRSGWENTKYVKANEDVLVLVSRDTSLKILATLKQDTRGRHHQCALTCRWSIALTGLHMYEQLLTDIAKTRCHTVDAITNELTWLSQNIDDVIAPLFSGGSSLSSSAGQDTIRAKHDYINQLTGGRHSEWVKFHGHTASSHFFERATGETTSLAFGVLHSAMAQPYQWITTEGLDTAHGNKMASNSIMAKDLRLVVESLLGKLGFRDAFELRATAVRFVPIMEEKTVYEPKTILTPYR